MESSGLQSMVNTMVWSVLEPAKASLSPESNIFQAFRSSRGNDCYAMAMFGMQYISLIRNGTNALKFFHAIQGMVARWLYQNFKIVCVWPFGLLDYGSAMLRCQI